MLDSAAVPAADFANSRPDGQSTERKPAGPLQPGALRVGFVTQLLWSRYGRFWVDLVTGAGAEPVFAPPEAVLAALPRFAQAPVPGANFRLSVAQAFVLADCDIVVLPRLNPDSPSQRGGAQDRWIADLPGAVQDIVGALGEVQAVAAYPDPDIESAAVGLLRRLLGDAATVPRVWSRHRRAAERQAEGSSSGRRRERERAAAGKLSVGGVTALVGQPWVVTPKVTARLEAADEKLVSQLSLDPERCREEGRRSDERLIDTDAEVIGAVRILSRRAGVSSLRFLVDAPDGSATDAWLLKRAATTSHKPLEPWSLADALPAAEFYESLLHSQHDLSVD